MSTLIQPRYEGTIRMKDGRKIGLAEFGPADGRPLLWFHGTPGARRQIAPKVRTLAEQRGVRIICVERPGVGDSSPHHYDAIADFAADIERIADSLNLMHFGVAGLSGGGPFALACAAKMPDRVIMAAILGGVAPSTGPDAADGAASEGWRKFGWVAGTLHKPMSGILRGAIKALEPLGEPAIKLFARFMPEGDQRVFSDPLVREMFVDDLVQGSRGDMKAMFLDARLFGRDWGFRLADIEVPVFLIYGDADTIVPIAHGHHMAESIPSSNLMVRAEAGHLGGLEASTEIIDVFLSHWPHEGEVVAKH